MSVFSKAINQIRGLGPRFSGAYDNLETGYRNVAAEGFRNAGRSAMAEFRGARASKLAMGSGAAVAGGAVGAKSYSEGDSMTNVAASSIGGAAVGAAMGFAGAGLLGGGAYARRMEGLARNTYSRFRNVHMEPQFRLLPPKRLR